MTASMTLVRDLMRTHEFVLDEMRSNQTEDGFWIAFWVLPLVIDSDPNPMPVMTLRRTER